MNKRLYVLAHQQARQNAAQAVLLAPEGYEVRIAPPSRSSAQNALLWSRLDDIAKQVQWHGRKLDAEGWKHLFTAALHAYEVVPNLNGNGFVALGKSTARMRKQEMADLLQLIEAFGTEHDVRWTLDE